MDHAFRSALHKTEDAEVEAELERVRARYSRTIAVTDRAAAMGDTVDINYEGFVDGVAFDGGKADNHKLKLGSGAFIPGFDILPTQNIPLRKRAFLLAMLFLLVR